LFFSSISGVYFCKINFFLSSSVFKDTIFLSSSRPRISKDKIKSLTPVSSGFQTTQSTVDNARQILHDSALNNDEKVGKLCKIIPENDYPIQAVSDAKKLKDQLEFEETQGDEFDVLTSLSRKLQNRVADIIRYLEFETDNKTNPLYLAVIHYQSEKNITRSAPDVFLEEHEHKAIYRDNKFRVW
jgi:uncharacterized FlaG/YvyC family protein